MTDLKTRESTATDIALIAAFAALTVAATLIPLGFDVGGVPATLQTLTVLLAGAVLGAKRGLLANALYVAMGLAGLPVFAGGKAGFGVMVGPTGGYLIGFLAAAVVTGFLVERFLGSNPVKNLILIFAAGFAGLIVLTACGIAGFMVNVGLSAMDSLKLALVFLPFDLAKTALMAFVAAATHRAFPGTLIARRT
ncbi:MAG: biotin transporter BioY [Aeromicrobium sp.]|nr:MAG: biotin transporter BioY [Aeromicrobium sp.]